MITNEQGKKNILAMFQLYRNAHPKLNTDAVWRLMKEREAEFLGLSLLDEDVKKLNRKINISKGTYFKKRKKKK